MTDEPVAPVDAEHLAYDVVVDHDDWGAVEPLVETCFKTIMAHDPETFCRGVIALLFTSDEAVQGLNKQYLGKDKPTNVLSFPSGEDFMETDEPVHIGDIALAYETCYREAVEKGIPLKDHTAHLIFHGILHLFGYDHVDDTEAEVMEKLERDLLADMGIKDPYAE